MLSIGAILVLIPGICVAVVSDLFSRRIPNALTFALAFLGVALNVSVGLWEGLIFSVSGLVTGLLCFLPFYFFTAMGAGDVKLLAAIGALIGPKMVVVAAIMTVAAGGLIAICYVAIRGGWTAMLARYSSMLTSLAAGHPHYIPPATGEAAGRRFPYALAIACGTAAAIVFLY